MDNLSNPKSSNNWLLIGLISMGVCAILFLLGACIWSVYSVVRVNSAVAASPTSIVDVASTPTADVIQDVSNDPSWDLYLDDDFSNNTNHWSVDPYQNDNITLKRYIRDGKFVWNFDAKESWTFWDYPKIKALEDFVVAVDIKHASGSATDGYGLALRGVGGSSYIFFVSETGSFSFVLRYDNKWNRLIDNKSSDAIHASSNRIVVKAVGPQFTLYINNQEVGQVEDDRLKLGSVGIVVAPDVSPAHESTGSSPSLPTVFEIERFRIWLRAVEQEPTDSSHDLAPLTPEKGRIVYTSDRDGNLEIYASNSDGSNLHRITNNPADDYAPKWSPDGSKIAFISTRDRNPELYIMNPDGSDITRLTNDSANEIQPDWAPDGVNLAFISDLSGNNEIYVYSFKDKTIKQVTDDGITKQFPTWSPTGNEILFQSEPNGIANIFIVNLNTMKTSQKTFARFHQIMPVWSSDGKFILFVDQLDLHRTSLVIKNMTAAERVHITDADTENLWPNWSPSNEQIIFVSDRDGQSDIYITDREGKTIFQVTDDDARESYVDWIE